MKEIFYVFLDTDGVLWDWKWRLSALQSKTISQKLTLDFNPESINALNFLLSGLEKVYDVMLVISSVHRSNMARLAHQLKNQGLTYQKEIDKTPVLHTDRGLEILNYLQNKSYTKNFLIIDDEIKDIIPYFSIDNIIKTDINSHSLSVSDIENFLFKLNVNKNSL